MGEPPAKEDADRRPVGRQNSWIRENFGIIVNYFYNFVVGKRQPWIPLTLAVAASATAVAARPECSTSQGVRCALPFVFAIVLSGWRYFLPLPDSEEEAASSAGDGGAPHSSLLGRLFRQPEPLGQILAVSALLLNLGGGFFVSYLHANGDLDVTGRFAYQGELPLVDGATVTASARLDDSRDRLLLTLELTDRHPDLPTCVPTASASVELYAGDGPAARAVEATTGEEVEIPLGGARTELDLAITLHAGKGCRMDVTISRAILRN